jgi:uncharacterized protein DUF5916
MTRPSLAFIGLNAVACLAAAGGALAADAAATTDSPPLTITRAAGSIAIDGALDDAGWKDVARIDTWFETNPGDNVTPKVRSVGYLTYDDKFFYAGFEFEDPEPRKIKAPLGDRDNVPGDTDYAGVILDARNDGKTAMMFLANASGIQYDAFMDDSGNGEDSSPDFFWDSAARITDKGWTLEMRIPFSSLRYGRADVQTWRIMLYRNYPREYRYQMFNNRIPRGGFCRGVPLNGLRGLPAGGSLTLAPYASANRASAPIGDPGTPLKADPIGGDIGLDVKWTPTASVVLDGTINPDFSQIESDVAQIAANERFALNFPEKRPFFLEGVDLFTTPIQVLYTRTITAPRWGVRGTGKLAHSSFTALVSEDGGGGVVVLPGPLSSDEADQDFRSLAAVGRARREIGRSFVSVLFSAREVSGGGHNHVVGPDFQWRPNTRDTVSGQFLYSASLTPDRPDLSAEWNGQGLHGHAVDTWYQHTTSTIDWFGEYRDFGDGFRADNGFVPQVGMRDAYAEAGYTFRPKGFLRRLRAFSQNRYTTDHDGNLLQRTNVVGAGMDGKWNSFYQFRYSNEEIDSGEGPLPVQRFRFVLQASPSRLVSALDLDGFVGQEIDFDNHRVGTGANVTVAGTLRPTNHFEVRLNATRRWLNVAPTGVPRGRLFTAEVERVRATYTFTPRMFVRGIVQYVSTIRDPRLFLDPEGTDRRTGSVATSALIAYKLNWQTVLFVGYGDANEFALETDRFEPSDRQVFLKLSYAFQR